MGEPGGIGPEITVKAALSEEITSICIPIVIGAKKPIEDAIGLIGGAARIKLIHSPAEAATETNVVNLIEAGHLEDYRKKSPSPEGGRASYEFIKKATELAMGGQVRGICTAPISKEALKMAGVQYPGHTEMLSALTDTPRYAMMLMGGPLRVVLVTTHAAISKVPSLITRAAVLEKIRIASEAARMLAVTSNEIAVCGLNPHAGEGGLFGREEIDHIAPAIEDAKKEGINATGPHPADALFRRAWTGDIGMIVAMYHDQGLVALKMAAFDTGVNVTLGLPIVRTSPDHGTAYDIAWKGTARAESMIEAVRTAVKLIQSGSAAER